MRGCPICEAFGEQYCRKHGSDDLEATIARLTAERDALVRMLRIVKEHGYGSHWSSERLDALDALIKGGA